MTTEEIGVKIGVIENKLELVDTKINTLETEYKSIQELALSVRELSINMQNMAEEQKRQSADLAVIKNKPADRLNSIHQTIVNTIVGVFAGAIATGLIFMMAQHI